MIKFHLLGHERFIVGDYPIQTVLSVETEYHVVKSTCSEEQQAFTSRLEEIRTVLHNITQDWIDQKISTDERDRKYREHWLPLVRVNMGLWDKTFVPLDVRNSMEEIERDLGIEVTKWPSMPVLEMKESRARQLIDCTLDFSLLS